VTSFNSCFSSQRNALYKVTVKEIDTFSVLLKRNYVWFSQNTYMVLQYVFFSLDKKITYDLCVSTLSHNRYQYDSLIPSKQTWAYLRQHLLKLLWYQGRWRGADVTKEYLETNFNLSSTPAFPKLWSADHRWSSGSALVVLLDWTLVQKRQKK
jgi:hypothetical protein